jgi:hypothetical protein
MENVVKILEGPFDGFYGVVVEATNEKAKCLVPIFGIGKEIDVSTNGITYDVPLDAKENTLEGYRKYLKSID